MELNPIVAHVCVCGGGGVSFTNNRLWLYYLLSLGSTSLAVHSRCDNIKDTKKLFTLEISENILCMGIF